MFLYYLDSDRQCERTSSINLPRAPHKIVHQCTTLVFENMQTRFVTFVQWPRSSAPIASGERIFSRRECINYVVSDLGHRTRAWDSLTGKDSKKMYREGRPAGTWSKSIIAFQNPKCIRCVWCARWCMPKKSLCVSCRRLVNFKQPLGKCNLIFIHSIWSIS